MVCDAERLKSRFNSSLAPYRPFNSSLAPYRYQQAIYLVRFEGEDGNPADLGPPVGCLPEELTRDEAWASAHQP